MSWSLSLVYFESLLTSLLTLLTEVFDEKNKCQQRLLESSILGASEKQSALQAFKIKGLHSGNNSY